MTKRTYFTMSDCGLSTKDIDSLLGELDSSSFTQELTQAIWDKYFYNWIEYVDQDLMDSAETAYSKDKLDVFMLHLRSVFRLTKDKYLALLGYYDKCRDNLMSKLNSITKTKFNDTPQNAGDFSDESYTSTYTEVEADIDPQPIADRLEKVQSMYRSLLRDWVNEFKGLFGEEIA